MLIKEADDTKARIDELERVASGVGPEAKRAADDLRRIRAGQKGEAESAYLINFEFAKSPNWAVIHDLRLECNGRVAQVDHLLINRWMDVYVLESKHFHAGLKITEEGEFLRWNNLRKTFEGMASPIEQNERHIVVLREVFSRIELPVRLGVTIPPSFSSLILVSPTARIDRPKAFDSSRVIKADQLKKRIWKDIDGENPVLGLLKTAVKIVSPETVEHVARQLVKLHVPSAMNTPSEPAPVRTIQENQQFDGSGARTVAPDQTQGPTCKACGQPAGEILYGKYGYYFKCSGCGANTGIRFTCQPGHNARLRKEGLSFFRECADCGSSSLYFRNSG